LVGSEETEEQEGKLVYTFNILTGIRWIWK